MRTIKTFIQVLLFTAAVLAVPSFAQAQESATIPLDDLKKLQKLAVEREHYKTAYEDEQKKSAGWEASATSWKGLYESEKRRADEVQGGRITELLKANQAYKDQAALDQQRLGQLEFDNRKLKSQRKYWFGAGLATGGVAGGYVGYRIAQIRF